MGYKISRKQFMDMIGEIDVVSLGTIGFIRLSKYKLLEIKDFLKLIAFYKL